MALSWKSSIPILQCKASSEATSDKTVPLLQLFADSVYHLVRNKYAQLTESSSHAQPKVLAGVVMSRGERNPWEVTTIMWFLNIFQKQEFAWVFFPFFGSTLHLPEATLLCQQDLTSAQLRSCLWPLAPSVWIWRKRATLDVFSETVTLRSSAGGRWFASCTLSWSCCFGTNNSWTNLCCRFYSRFSVRTLLSFRSWNYWS